MPSTHRAYLSLSLLLLSLTLLSTIPGPLNAQVPAPAQDAPQPVRLYLDCHASGCYDLDYLRTEIQFVDFVRDLRDADVYLLITSQRTGAGGSSSELIFTGQGRFEGMEDRLTYVSSFDATADEIRQGLTGIIKIGLMRYVGLTPLAGDITIGMRRPELGPAGPPRPGPAASPEEDPWDFWVFRVRGSAGLNGRSGYRSRRFSGSLSASRITEEWKVSLSLSSSYSETRYEYEDLGYSSLNVIRSHSFSGELVKAIAGKWSAGLRTSGRNATYYNFDLEVSVAPVLEYSVFPYEEATRRSLTFQYALEGVYSDYREQTLFFKNEETFVTQSLAAMLGFTQPWGSASFAIEGAHHLENVDLHHLSVFGNLNLRLTRGLSLTVFGQASRVHDLISVAANAGDEIEDILLSRRQLQTDYTYSTSIGLTYTFGSIFNNIVNPRLSGTSGAIIMM